MSVNQIEFFLGRYHDREWWLLTYALFKCTNREKNFNFLRRGDAPNPPAVFSFTTYMSFSMTTSYLILSRSYNENCSFPTTRMGWLPSNGICHRFPNLYGDGILTEGMLNENVV